MKKVKVFEDFINESIDVKYWTDYNTDTSGQADPSHATKYKVFDIAFEEGVETWNAEADGKENQIGNKEADKIERLAKEFFKKAGWISINVIHAMIAQEGIRESIEEKTITIDWNDDENSLVFSDAGLIKVDYDGEFKYRGKWFSTAEHEGPEDLIKDLSKEFKGDKFTYTNEAFINEDKKLDRDAFIALLKDKYKFTFVRTSEDFDGSKGGIWTSGESSPLLGGKKIYNYYGEGSAYDLGVLKKFEDAINKLGWYSEWYDAGTMNIWPI
jgi:hypothetical protein